MKDRKIFYLTAFKYVVPADYEKWFEELAYMGWHPVRVGQWSSIAMRFDRGEPVKYRYVVDMQAMPKKDYRKTYEEFGWELVGQMASAFVWRRKYADERPESFSDLENIKRRNKRFIWAVSVSFFMFLLASIAVTIGFIVTFSSLSAGDFAQFALGIALSYGLTIYLGSVMKKIGKNIDR
jgi:hypothetical protein